MKLVSKNLSRKFAASLFALALGTSGLALAGEGDDGSAVAHPSRQTGDVAEAAGAINLTDAIRLLSYLYLGGNPPVPVTCEPSTSGDVAFVPRFANGTPGNTADVNGDSRLDITDPLVLLNWLFLGGPAPAQMSCVAATSGSV